MYYDFFGFREPPFSIAPDPRYLYLSDRHKEALAHLMYGVQGQGGFIVITGGDRKNHRFPMFYRKCTGQR